MNIQNNLDEIYSYIMSNYDKNKCMKVLELIDNLQNEIDFLWTIKQLEIMNKKDFIWLCNEHSVNPSIVMEDEGAIQILKEFKGTIFQQMALNSYLTKNY